MLKNSWGSLSLLVVVHLTDGAMKKYVSLTDTVTAFVDCSMLCTVHMALVIYSTTFAGEPHRNAAGIVCQHFQACSRDACSLIMQTGSSPATLASLDREVLTGILSLLDPVSLATVSCTNRELRSLSSSAVLWTTLCKSRWQNMNTPCLVCHTQSTKFSEEDSKQRTTSVAATNNSHSLADPHALYAINNCWGGLQLTEIEGHRTFLSEDSFADFCVSTAAAADVWPNSHASGDIVYTLGRTLSMWSTGDCTQAGTLFRSHPTPIIQPYCSITELAIGLVAAGRHDGTIDTYNLLPENLSKETISHHWYTGSR